MIQQVVKKMPLSAEGDAREDLAFWLSQPAEKRLDAVELLRRQFNGNTARLQRTARVIQRPRG